MGGKEITRVIQAMRQEFADISNNDYPLDCEDGIRLWVEQQQVEPSGSVTTGFGVYIEDTVSMTLLPGEKPLPPELRTVILTEYSPYACEGTVPAWGLSVRDLLRAADFVREYCKDELAEDPHE